MIPNHYGLYERDKNIQSTTRATSPLIGSRLVTTHNYVPAVNVYPVYNQTLYGSRVGTSAGTQPQPTSRL